MRPRSRAAAGAFPILHQPLKLNDAVNLAVDSHERVIAAWEDETIQGLKAALGEKQVSALALFCGPEGGFDPAEIELMRSAGVHFFSLGRRILRMETAAILAPALVLYELGEMTVDRPAGRL